MIHSVVGADIVRPKGLVKLRPDAACKLRHPCLEVCGHDGLVFFGLLLLLLLLLLLAFRHSRPTGARQLGTQMSFSQLFTRDKSQKQTPSH